MSVHKRFVFGFWLVLTALTAGCVPAPPGAAPPGLPVVSVSEPIQREVTDYEDFTGRTDAVSTVDVKARVSGYLIKVAFKDGDILQEGTLLYQIDPRPFQADLDQANGQVERLRAQKKLLEIQVARYEKLAEKGAGTQQELDQYTGQRDENVGALKAALAQVDRAKLSVEFATLKAPITGKISRTLITAGNLVNADTTLLTTIMSIDPMYAYFNIEEPTMLRIQKMIREGVIPTKATSDVEVQMGLADDTERKFPLHGTLDFVNNTVDPQTGTIQVRGRFDNPYELPLRKPLLTPGMFVRVRLPMSVQHKALLVNERAIGTDQGQKFVYVVDHDNKIAYRRVKLGLVFDGLQAVEEGLRAGDRVVVTGLQRIRPNIEVKAEHVDMLELTPVEARMAKHE